MEEERLADMVVEYSDDIIVIQSQVYRPDMRKRVANHGSPKPKFGSINIIFEYIIKIRNKWFGRHTLNRINRY